jgi:hypothetical protein
LEEKKNTQLEGEYDFSDYLLGNEETFYNSDAIKQVGQLKRDWKPYY